MPNTRIADDSQKSPIWIAGLVLACKIPLILLWHLALWPVDVYRKGTKVERFFLLAVAFSLASITFQWLVTGQSPFCPREGCQPQAKSELLQELEKQHPAVARWLQQ